MKNFLKKLFSFGSSIKKDHVFLGIFFTFFIVIMTTPLQAHAQWFNFAEGAVEGALSIIAETVLRFVSLLTGFAAIILNGVVHFTIIKMAESYGQIPAIKTTWSLLRDLANMSFIFILLTAAIRTVLGVGGDNKTLIVKLIVAAILINFSMFFTGLVIDAGNILAVLFYHSINPVGAAAGNPWSNGLSDAFMQYLKLTELYRLPNGGEVTASSIITVGVMGSLMLLIAAFSFLAVALLLIIRYVILILLLIFSPLAVVGDLLPGLSKYKNQWQEALIGQTFFAPIYFFLTLVSLTVLGGITKNVFGSGANSSAAAGVPYTNPDDLSAITGFMPTLLSYSTVIIFMIASLIIAKDWANKAGPGASKLTGWAMGTAGGVALGAGGLVGRHTLGRRAANTLNNQDLLDKASEKGLGGKMARLQLAASRRVAESSFDLRATKVGGATVGRVGAGKEGGKGGYLAFKKKRVEDEAKRAAALAPSDEVINQAEQNLKNTRELDHTTEQFGEEHKKAFLEQGRVAREKQSELQLARERQSEYTASVRNGLIKVDPEIVRKQREDIEKKEKEVAEAEAKKKAINTREGYKAQKVEEAKRNLEKLKGVPVDEVKSRIEDEKRATLEAFDAASKDEPLDEDHPSFEAERVAVERVKNIEDDIKRKQEELDKTLLDGMKEIREKEIEEKKKELEAASQDVVTAKKESEQARLEIERNKENIQKRRVEERKKIEDDFDKMKISATAVNNAAERRKKDYADVVENSFWGKRLGYNTAAAAQIRKGKSDEERFTELARKLKDKEDAAKKKDDGKDEAEEPKTPPPTTPSPTPPSPVGAPPKP